MKCSEIILLVVSCVQTIFISGSCIIAFLAYRKNEATKKTQFVFDLQKEFLNNTDLYEAMHLIEFKSGWFSGLNFYTDQINQYERKIDRLFIFLSNIIKMYNKGQISYDDFSLFEYKIHAVFQSQDAQKYLEFINNFSQNGRLSNSSFQPLIEYGRKQSFLKF